MDKNKKLEFYGGYLVGLVPMIIFTVFCIVFFIVFKVFKMEALAMGGLVALMIGCFFSKDWSSYWDAVMTGMSKKSNSILIMILLVVGIFTGLMGKSGIAYGFVWLGDKIGLTGGPFVAFSFVAACVIATSTGTSIGTLMSTAPVLYPAGVLLGADPVIMAAALLGGATFGDNLAPVSDTTIASATTQSYTLREGTAEIGGVVSTRFRYSIVAGLIAIVLFIVLGGKGSGEMSAEATAILAQTANPKGLIMLIPIGVLLFIAIRTQKIFNAIIWGIVSGTIVGLISGIITPADILSVKDGAVVGFLYEGFTKMMAIVMYTLILFGIIGVLEASGIIERVIDKITESKLASTPRGTEFCIGTGIIVSCLLLGSSCAAAILMFGPISDKLGKKQHLHPFRRANLTDGFACTLSVITPSISAFIFMTTTAVQNLIADYPFIEPLNPLALSAHCFYQMLLFAVLAFSVITGWGRQFEGPGGKPVKTYEEAERAAADGVSA